MTDLYPDQLFALPQGEAAPIQFPVSQLILDAERFVDDAEEPMAARGMGVIYTRGSRSQILRETPSPEERTELLASFYEPHHWALAEAVELALGARGHCLVIDCHSFPPCPLHYEPGRRPDRPDICPGTDPYRTPQRLAALAGVNIVDDGFQVALNRPYAGALVPASHFHLVERVLAIMVEVNRAIYMDKENGERLPEFKQLVSRIRNLIRGLIRQTRMRSVILER